MSNNSNNSKNNIYFSDYLKNGKKRTTLKDVLLFFLPILVIGIIALIVLFVGKFKTDKNVHQDSSSLNNDVYTIDESDLSITTTSPVGTEVTTISLTTIYQTQIETTMQTTETTTNPINEVRIGFVITQKDPLNVREKTSKDSKVIGTIPKGGKVSIISEKDDWYEVNYFGETGYVAKQFISFSESDIPQNNTNMTKTGKVNTEKDPLNVRKQPSTDSLILGKLPKDSKITIVDEVDDWYVIDFGDDRGYISKKYVIIID